MSAFPIGTLGAVGVKDSRWLQLEVCREFQRSKCTRSDTECKFAHPQSHVDVLNGKVTACFDSIKGRCNREQPPCKYFHPPHHLKEQLLVNGRNNLALKNAVMQQLTPVTTSLPVNGGSQVLLACPSNPEIAGSSAAAAAHMYGLSPLAGGLGSLVAAGQYYTNPAAILHAQQQQQQQQQQASIVDPSHMHQLAAAQLHQIHQLQQLQQIQQLQQQQQQQQQQKLVRLDRLEVCREFLRGTCKRSEQECRYAHPPDHVSSDDGHVTVCMDAVKGRCGRDPCRYYHPSTQLLTALRASHYSPVMSTSSAGSSSVGVAAAPLNGSCRKRTRDHTEELPLAMAEQTAVEPAPVYYGATPGVNIPLTNPAGFKRVAADAKQAVVAPAYPPHLLLAAQQHVFLPPTTLAPCEYSGDTTAGDTPSVDTERPTSAASNPTSAPDSLPPTSTSVTQCATSVVNALNPALYTGYALSKASAPAALAAQRHQLQQLQRLQLLSSPYAVPGQLVYQGAAVAPAGSATAAAALYAQSASAAAAAYVQQLQPHVTGPPSCVPRY